MKKYYTIRNQYWNFGFFHKVFFEKKNDPILITFVSCGWLTNLSLLFQLR